MDLLSPHPFWPIRDGLPATFPSLAKSLECDVAIIGAGITGALLATTLSAAGFDVVVLDRRDVAHGSTAGNTGIVLYELDQMLHQLARQMGADAANRVYMRCCRAVEQLDQLVRAKRIACEFARRQSLFLAATRGHVARLRREFEARREAGLPVTWWSRAAIARESSLPHPAAILSGNAAEVDAYQLTYGLLSAAQQKGVRIFDQTEVVRHVHRRTSVDLHISRGVRVRARHLVIAAGFEAERFLPRRVGVLWSTYALITEPIPRDSFAGWPADRCVIWDSGNPYLYLRTTGDDRAIIGGYDDRFRGHAHRDRQVRAKAGSLQRRFRSFFPAIPCEVATAWSGTFETTADTLPYIGQCRGVPHTWFALGFGGNGTTFAVIAAEIIRDALLGRDDPDAPLFGFER